MKTATPSFLKLNFRPSGNEIKNLVHYTTGESMEGLVLVGRSQQGICAIFLGDDPHELRAQLIKAFPHAELLEDANSLQQDLNLIIELINTNNVSSNIELDIGGTPFQQKVWQALCAIPAGETRSYTEVAESLGAPGAARAVAGACAANVLAIAIPCHRVVRGDGSLSGYRWGVQRKQALLAKENTTA